MDGIMDGVTPPLEKRSMNATAIHAQCIEHMGMALRVNTLETRFADYVSSTNDSIAGLSDSVDGLRDEVTQLKIKEAARDQRLKTMDGKLDELVKGQEATNTKLNGLIIKVAIYTGGGIAGGGGLLYGLIEGIKLLKGG